MRGSHCTRCASMMHIIPVRGRHCSSAHIPQSWDHCWGHRIAASPQCPSWPANDRHPANHPSCVEPPQHSPAQGGGRPQAAHHPADGPRQHIITGRDKCDHSSAWSWPDHLGLSECSMKCSMMQKTPQTSEICHLFTPPLLQSPQPAVSTADSQHPASSAPHQHHISATFSHCTTC